MEAQQPRAFYRCIHFHYFGAPLFLFFFLILPAASRLLQRDPKVTSPKHDSCGEESWLFFNRAPGHSPTIVKQEAAL